MAKRIKKVNPAEPVKQPESKKRRPATPAPWTFPKNSLDEALAIPKAIEEKNGGNPMSADLLVRAVGLRKSSDWRFLDVLKSANLYGLVIGSGASAIVELTEIGRDVVAPASPIDRRNALLRAFRTVDDFQKVDEFYGGKRLPEDEYFLNTLTRQFKIPKERADLFALIFRQNISFLKSFDIETQTADLAVSAEHATEAVDISKTVKDKRVREFLDICFVMMPFGGWFDRYYQEIYVPAIKEAGLEPVRADELFSTGSVVEQIWEQISKSKVLLADLTEKNANVFYELGLAHAARKPVVHRRAN